MRAKEFLSSRGVDFTSVDVINDPGGMDELTALGIMQLPVLRAGDRTVAGFDLDAIADLIGIEKRQHEILPPETLYEKLQTILESAQRLIAAFPDDRLSMTVPRREQRDVRALGYHVFRIPVDFIEALEGAEYRAGTQPVPETIRSAADIVAFGEDVRRRLAAWFPSQSAAEWRRTLATSYGA
ncbi:MAG: glutaredoxin family protein, partial [Candidatus Eremiobacteraeota bacterium]|nr:glutaredoxin family protein [Candidatus Eremiobacteraeota bacterium]